MITIVMIIYELANVFRLPDKFNGSKEDQNKGKREGLELDEGGRPEEEQGKEE